MACPVLARFSVAERSMESGGAVQPWVKAEAGQIPQNTDFTDDNGLHGLVQEKTDEATPSSVQIPNYPCHPCSPIGCPIRVDLRIDLPELLVLRTHRIEQA